MINQFIIIVVMICRNYCNFSIILDSIGQRYVNLKSAKRFFYFNEILERIIYVRVSCISEF
jgi:hypothetical protein